MKTETDGAGLSEQQLDFLHNTMEMVLSLLHRADPRGRHFVLMILTHEGVASDGCDLVSTDMLASMDNESMQDAIRDWLHHVSH